MRLQDRIDVGQHVRKGCIGQIEDGIGHLRLVFPERERGELARRIDLGKHHQVSVHHLAEIAGRRAKEGLACG